MTAHRNRYTRHRWLDEHTADAEPDACITWPFATDGRYGRMWHDGEYERAHVIACSIHHGPRPAGMEAAHSCGEALCVNPHHLRWATVVDNAAVKEAHGTVVRGVDHYRATLTTDQVSEIRRRYAAGGVLQRDLAAEFGVTRGAISMIVIGKNRKVA